MTEYTPTTEQVRDGFATDPVAEYNDPITNHTALGRRAFDRWLRAHDAEVAANAWDQGYACGFGYVESSTNPYRADRIEREATNHKPNPELGSSETERGDR